MDTAKKMMEKWGWNKGQGLGKNKQGMASCLVLKKQDGSASQGRIMMGAPEKVKNAGAAQALLEAEPSAEQTEKISLLQQKQQQIQQLQAQKQSIMQQQQQLLQQHGGQVTTGMNTMMDAANRANDDKYTQLMATLQQSGALGAAAPGGSAAPAAKRQRVGWDTDTSARDSTGGLYDIDPREAPPNYYDVDPRDADAAALAKANADLQAQQAQQAQLLQGGQGAAIIVEEDKPSSRPTLAAPKQRVRVRQWVQDDWRWSKGTEALRYFEEVSLAPSLVELAHKILGPGSRYPGRITDDTDCITEVTAWGTLLVRPRGTGANISLAKRMLYEILHPSGELLREDALITKDEKAEAAVRDQTTIFKGADDEEAGGHARDAKLTTGVKRSFQHDLRHMGLGAEEQAIEESEKKHEGKVQKSETKTMELILDEDVALVKKHMDDLRMATGAVVTLTGHTLKMLGKERAVRKAEHLTNTLIETGEWVALQDSFVISEADLLLKRASEGPAEQILIKIPDGPVTQKIEKCLKAIERAALADALKLTSKAVAGKRTLMVDGSKAAHERVKLMVKELSERGESPMLTKFLGAMKLQENDAGAKEGPKPTGLVKAEVKTEVKKELVAVKEEDGVSVTVAPGVIQAKAVLRVKEEIKDDDDEVKAEDDAVASATVVPSAPSKGIGPSAMRRMPAPKLKVDAVKLEDQVDLFMGLPQPDLPSGGSSGSSAGVTVINEEDAEPAPFPPLPPGLRPPSAAKAGSRVIAPKAALPKTGGAAAATAAAGAAGALLVPPGLRPPGAGVQAFDPEQAADGITE